MQIEVWPQQLFLSPSDQVDSGRMHGCPFRSYVWAIGSTQEQWSNECYDDDLQVSIPCSYSCNYVVRDVMA